VSHGLRFGCLAMTPTRSRQEWLDQARQTEERGFSTLQVSDHFVRTPLAPLVALSAAAQVTSTIRLGTLVLDNDFRHPAVLAKEISTLDQLSDGRVELGLGAGWLDEDYEVSGITMDSPGARINRLAEAVQVLRGAFTGDAVSTKGTHYRADGLRAVPHPVQRPAPPLLLGGGGPRVLRLAARHADIVGISLLNAEGHTGPGSARSAYEDAIDEKVAVVRAAATEAGRDPQLHVIAYWAEVTDEPESAIRRKIDQLGIPVTPKQLVHSPHCLIGPLGYLTDRIAQLRERWGFSYFTLYDRDAQSCASLVSALAES